MYTIRVNGHNIRRFRLCSFENDPAVTTAAVEISTYLQLQASCSNAEGTVFVGLVKDIPEVKQLAKQIAEEGILIKISDSNIYIAGGSGRSTIYAAYEFLEKYCGWGFYAPGLETEPEGLVELKDLEYIFNPPFGYRMNLLPSNGSGTSHFLKRHLNAKWGPVPLPPEQGGSEIYATNNCHTFRELISDKEYYEEHPEYFGVDENGKTFPQSGDGAPPCLSNPKVYDIVLENLLAAIRRHPSARYVSVSQNDGMEFCHCEACRKVNEEEGTDGGTVYRFVNRIAAAVEKEYPHILVETIPYNYSTKPPVKTVMRDNVAIRLCLMATCREHTIADESCPYNEKVRAYLQDWSKICKHLEIWDYNANYQNYPISIPNFKLLYQNVRRLRSYPVKGILFLGAHTTDPDIEFSALWGYLQGRLAWNPDMTYVEYLRDTKNFLKAYYGDGGTYLYDYLMLTLMQPSSDYHYGPSATCEQIIPMLKLPDGSPDMTYIRDANDLFDLAEAASSGEALERIRRTRLHLDWYELCTTYKFVRANGTEEEKAVLRGKYEKFISAVNKWERFCVRETVAGKMYGKQFDFEIDPNSFIGA